jgi:hypothetical protein
LFNSPYISFLRKEKTQINAGEYWWWLVVQIPPAAPFISMHPDNIRIE